MLDKSKVALGIEAEKVGPVGTVAVVGVPHVVGRVYVVSFENKTAPSVEDAQSIDWILPIFDKVDHLPRVVYPVAVRGDCVRKLQVYVDHRHRLRERIRTIHRITCKCHIQPVGNQHNIVVAYWIVVIIPHIMRIHFER